MKVIFSKTAREMGSCWSSGHKVKTSNDTFSITYRNEDGHKVVLRLEPDDRVVVLRKRDVDKI